MPAMLAWTTSDLDWVAIASYGPAETLGDLNQERLHRAEVDRVALVERYGADLLVAELVKRAVCSECGSRWPRLSITVAVENAPRVIPDRSAEVER
jgi:hypothetical protein